MKNNIFIKEYIAIVNGIMDNKKGIIEAPISRKENSIIERCVSEKGQRAITEYEVIKNSKDMSLVKCKLLTGRTHQIRVHMEYIGHPLLGDTLYGKESTLIKRQALHCYKIVFFHPVSHKKIELKIDLPKEFNII